MSSRESLLSGHIFLSSVAVREEDVQNVSFFTFQQAKTLKRQLKTEKQKAEEDSNKARTTEKVPLPAKSGVASASDPPKNSLFIQRASSVRTDNQTAANRSNNSKMDEQVDLQVKTGFPSFSFAKESFVKSREAPTQTSPPPATVYSNNSNTACNSHFDNNNNTTDNDKRNSVGNSVDNDTKDSKDSNTSNDENNNGSLNNKSSKEKELIEPYELENVASSSQITAESSLHSLTRPAETIASTSTKPLRERQLQPLPHFGDVIPPPLEFSENSGERKFKRFRKDPHPPCQRKYC